VVLAGCPATASHLLDRADELENRHHFAQAQTAYRDSLRRLGDSDTPVSRGLRTRALAHLADLCYLDIGDLKCAADSYHRLIENYPEAPETFEARTHLAEMLRDRLNDVTGAIAQYKALATAYPGKPGSDDFQFQAAEGYFGLHDYVQARSEARALIDKFPSSSRIPQARFLIASCYELEGQRPEAIKAYEDLLARDHGGEISPKAAVALAKLLEQQGDATRALQLLQQARLDPTEDSFVTEETRRLMHKLAKGAPPSREEIFGERGPVDEDEGGMARLKAEASLGPHGKGPTGPAMPHEPEPTGQGPRYDDE
jgi:tetratricopeptide (TPR) repeat protein